MKSIYKALIPVFISSFVFSTTPVKDNLTTVGFIENKGQIHDQNFNPNPLVKYLINSHGLNIQLKANSFSYDTYVIDENKSEPNTILKQQVLKNITYKFHRIDVEFIGSKSNPLIIAEFPSSTYYNYYTSGISENGATNIRSFSKITYKDIYPNTDLEFISSAGKIKYNFILHNGADINLIRWQYKGAATKLNSKNIEINVTGGIVNEMIPESYLTDQNNKSKSVQIKFKVFTDNIYGFAGSNDVSINVGQKLVIDPVPSVLWSTYEGGNLTDWFAASALDAVGNVFISGYTASASNVATAGASQTVYGLGAHDATLLKFNKNGALKWATYYGKNGDDQATAIAVGKSNDVYISGVTNSSSAMSTSGSHQTTYGGGSGDGFLARFDTSGIKQWGTYYGGSAYDDCWGCSLDKAGNVYVSGTTSSTNSISTIGSHQSSYGGGPEDSYVAKFNSSGVRQWSTYYGGTGDDVSVSCVNDLNGNIFMTGSATSSASIGTSGTYQPNYVGGYDAFLVKFNKNGVRQWGTYYGTDSLDASNIVYYDTIASHVYLGGFTSSIISVASAGAHQTVYGGNSYDGLLVKFDTLGSRIWGTYYGGSGLDLLNGITTDANNVYICGATSSSVGISTLGTFQTNYVASNEGFLVKFDKLGVRQWGTYYGSTGWDYGASTVIDKSGDIYFVGTSGSTGLATSGAYQINLGGSMDGICTKFSQSITIGISTSSYNNSLLKIYPNPSSTFININSPQNQLANSTIEIINCLGQIVLNLTYQNQIDISKLPTGFYSLRIITVNKEVYVSKFIKE